MLITHVFRPNFFFILHVFYRGGLMVDGYEPKTKMDNDRVFHSSDGQRWRMTLSQGGQPPSISFEPFVSKRREGLLPPKARVHFHLPRCKLLGLVEDDCQMSPCSWVLCDNGFSSKWTEELLLNEFRGILPPALAENLLRNEARELHHLQPSTTDWWCIHSSPDGICFRPLEDPPALPAVNSIMKLTTMEIFVYEDDANGHLTWVLHDLCPQKNAWDRTRLMETLRAEVGDAQLRTILLGMAKDKLTQSSLHSTPCLSDETREPMTSSPVLVQSSKQPTDAMKGPSEKVEMLWTTNQPPVPLFTSRPAYRSATTPSRLVKFTAPHA